MILESNGQSPQPAPPLETSIGLFHAFSWCRTAVESLADLADHIAAGGMLTERDRERAHQTAFVLRTIAQELKL